MFGGASQIPPEILEQIMRQQQQEQQRRWHSVSPEIPVREVREERSIISCETPHEKKALLCHKTQEQKHIFLFGSDRADIDRIVEQFKNNYLKNYQIERDPSEQVNLEDGHLHLVISSSLPPVKLDDSMCLVKFS